MCPTMFSKFQKHILTLSKLIVASLEVQIWILAFRQLAVIDVTMNSALEQKIL